MIRTRRAALTDVTQLLPHLRAFAAFAGHRHCLYPGDGEAAVKVAHLIRDHFFCVAEDVQVNQPTQLIGFIAGLLVPHWMNEEVIVLDELFWWVDPDHRGSKAGLMLLKEYCDFGEANAHQMTMTLENESPVKPETLQRFGLMQHERVFLKEMN